MTKSDEAEQPNLLEAIQGPTIEIDRPIRKGDKSTVRVMIGPKVVHADRLHIADAVKRAAFAKAVVERLAERNVEMTRADVEQLILQADFELTQQANPPAMPAETALEQSGLQVLAEDEAMRALVYCPATRKTTWLPRVSTLKPADLVQLTGGDPCGPNGRSVGAPSFEQIQSAIAAAAGQAPRYDNLQRCGQGIWEPVDDGQAILVVDGHEAFHYVAEQVSHVDSPLLGQRLIDRSESSAWHGSLSGDVLAATDAGARECFEQLLVEVKKWRWDRPENAECIAALIVATSVQRLWSWRPIVGVTGPTGAGKTLLREHVLSPVFGGGSVITDRASEAGVRQEIAHSARPLVLDEFDKFSHRQQVLELLRTSGRGGKTLRGTQQQQSVSFEIRHLAWLLGIELGDVWEQDANRQLVFELHRFNENVSLPSQKKMEDLGKKLSTAALRAAPQMTALAERIQSLRVDGVCSRVVESMAVAASTFSVMTLGLGATDDEATAVLRSMLLGRETVEQPEEQALLTAILTALLPYRSPEASAVCQRTVAELLTISDGNLVLESYGIKLCEHENLLKGRRLFIVPGEVSHKLLSKTRYRDTKLDSILMRIPGAEKKQLRIAGLKPYGVVVPLPCDSDHSDVETSSPIDKPAERRPPERASMKRGCTAQPGRRQSEITHRDRLGHRTTPCG